MSPSFLSLNCLSSSKSPLIFRCRRRQKKVFNCFFYCFRSNGSSRNLAWTQTKHAKSFFSSSSFSYFWSFWLCKFKMTTLPEGWIVFGNHVEIRYFCDQFLVGWALISSWSWKPLYLVDKALLDLLSIIEIACFWSVPRNVLKTDIKINNDSQIFDWNALKNLD